MDPQTPEVPVAPVVEPPKKDSHWITILAMALFVLASLGITAFLYYQNQALKKMLASYQSQPSSTPTATPDVTANWKTYTNAKYNYEIKYPPSLTPQKENNDLYLDFVSFTGNDSYKPYSIYVRQLKLEKEVETIRAQTEGHILATLTRNENTTFANLPATILEYTPDNPEVGPKATYFVIYKGKYSYVINTNSSNLNQILSTFQFIGPSEAPAKEDKACTQEAKLCPDGSYVGRTGPNCEFAPCPTPK